MATNAFVRLPPDGTGKRLDSDSLTIDSNLVHRERMRVAGELEAELAVVNLTDPAALAPALVVRLAPPDSPAFSRLTSASLAAGASVDLDAATIPAATTGKLMAVSVASSVACKWEIKTRDGAVLVEVDTLVTSVPGTPSLMWHTPHKDFVTLAGAGVDENFRINVTNLDDNLAADVYATLYWDEI